jgi:hypothetical protein
MADCAHGLTAIERIRKSETAAEVWFVTMTQGYWGATPRTPDEEAQNLKHYYVDRKQMGLNIALWAGPKERQSWGGMIPSQNPSATLYPLLETSFVIVDGRGIVRHILIGYTKYTERVLQSKLRKLIDGGATNVSAPTQHHP